MYLQFENVNTNKNYLSVTASYSVQSTGKNLLVKIGYNHTSREKELESEKDMERLDDMRSQTCYITLLKKNRTT